MCTPAPTANRYVLIATEGFKALGLVNPDYVVSNGFIPMSGTLNYAGVDLISYSSLPSDGVSALDRTGSVIPNVATNFRGVSASVSAAVANYQGLWWAAPAASESGWGLNLAHQGDTLFASWFTYDAGGKGWWLVMTANKTAPNTYSGKLYTTRGPAFNAVPWDPMAVVATEAGTGTLTFTDASNGTFNYVIGATNQTKSLTREVFGPLPTCTWGGGTGLAAATNYQDLWWKSPAASESGWGVNLNHEGDTIFATWFTYDLGGAPLWLVATATKTAPNVFSGDLLQTTGPALQRDAVRPEQGRFDQGRHGDVHVRRRQQRELRLQRAARGHDDARRAVEGDHARDLRGARHGLPVASPGPRTTAAGQRPRGPRGAPSGTARPAPRRRHHPAPERFGSGGPRTRAVDARTRKTATARKSCSPPRPDCRPPGCSRRPRCAAAP